MYVRHLNVVDFRSWAVADVGLEPGPNVLIGSNGEGKTNLVEALMYLVAFSSHRVSGDAALVRAGTERGVIRAAIVSDGRELRAELEINPGRANRARLNGAPLTRPRDLLGALRAVLFAPEDLAIVRGDPGERRRFLDDLVVQRSPRMAAVRSDYERVLKQRAALLKSSGAARRSGAKPDLSTLDVWDGHLASTGAALVAARLAALEALRPHTCAAYANLAPSSAALSLDYVFSLGEDSPEVGERDAEVLEVALLAALARSRATELDRGVNLFGPHRDDLAVNLGDLPVRGFASHGESWSAALALRLGSYELLRDEGAEPVLVLDDVFAELDTSRRAQLALVAGKAEQVLITAAVESDVPVDLAGARYLVKNKEISRVS